MEKHVLWSALASALVLASCNAGKGTVTENELKGNWKKEARQLPSEWQP